MPQVLSDEQKKLLEFCKFAIDKNREKWTYSRTGAHWSILIRFMKLYDFTQELLAEQQVIIDSAAEEIAKLKLQLFVEPECVWREEDDPDGSIWRSECKESFMFNDGGTPRDNCFNFCPYCGKRLIQEQYD